MIYFSSHRLILPKCHLELVIIIPLSAMNILLHL